MERRVLLAIFLAFLVLYTWQALFVKPAPKPGAARQRARAVDSRRAAGTDAGRVTSVDSWSSARRRPLPRRRRRQSRGAAASAALVGDTAEHDVRVETQDVIAVFTNRGARLKSWRLKRYLDQHNEPQELVEQALPDAAAAVHAADRRHRCRRDAQQRAVRADGRSAGCQPMRRRSTCASSTAISGGVSAVKEFHINPSRT